MVKICSSFRNEKDQLPEVHVHKKFSRFLPRKANRPRHESIPSVKSSITYGNPIYDYLRSYVPSSRYARDIDYQHKTGWRVAYFLQVANRTHCKLDRSYISQAKSEFYVSEETYLR